MGSIRTPADGEPNTAGNGDGGATPQTGGLIRNEFPDQSNGTVGNGTVTNPDNACDQDPATYAQVQVTGNGSVNGAWVAVSGAPHPWYDQARSVLVLKVDNAFPTNTLNGSGPVFWCEYSVDGGNNWTTLYSRSVGFTEPRGITYFNLIGTVKPELVRARIRVGTGTGSTSGIAVGRLYRAWLEYYI